MTYVDWGLDDDSARPTAEAEFTTECEACGDDILPGDDIVKEEGEWVHLSCATD